MGITVIVDEADKKAQAKYEEYLGMPISRGARRCLVSGRDIYLKVWG
jgi:hypothetical protein